MPKSRVQQCHALQRLAQDIFITAQRLEVELNEAWSVSGQKVFVSCWMAPHSWWSPPVPFWHWLLYFTPDTGLVYCASWSFVAISWSNISVTERLIKCTHTHAWKLTLITFGKHRLVSTPTISISDKKSWIKTNCRSAQRWHTDLLIRQGCFPKCWAKLANAQLKSWQAFPVWSAKTNQKP